MWNPIILSDEEEGNQKTPLPSLPKKPRTLPDPTILVLDVDDPTPHKSPSFVPETPLSDVSIVKCTFPRIRVPDFDPETLSGNAGLICLESENDEPESAKNWKEKTTMDAGYDEVEERRRWSTSTNFDSVDWLVDANVNQMSGVSSSQPSLSQDDICQIGDCPDKENFSMEQMACTLKEKRKTKVNSARENSADEAVGTKNTKKDERIRLMEEKKLKKEQEKLQKAALKAQAAELKKMEKEMQKWEKGKFALNSIVAEFDTRVIEHGSVGGPLLTRFADKGLTYRVTSNPIERSILWTMSAPEHISQLSREGTDIRYVALVYEAEEFCNLVMSESLLDHVSSVRSRYPSHTICYLTIRLMAYVNKRGKEQYKQQENDDGWRCPSVEEALAKLTTHFVRVHYRLCTDEAELADHVFGLTRSLASCQFRKKLTQLSVNANGSFIPKDFIDRNLIKKSPWLKALVAIPKVQPRFAIAIWKKYPTMKSLLSVYMDPNKSAEPNAALDTVGRQNIPQLSFVSLQGTSVHEKEFLLENLTTEGFIGGERRVGQICSKRVYRILMAQSGNIITDNVEDGADFFRNHSS
ncbi:crossover junction endonuclease EME1B-like [Populus alba x Populus x berolinensis]|nr:crossover junction endonuclease EME1B-like [Populus alba x Populus x berolinensis]